MNFDFAIVGETPLAAVLAGLLCKQHERNVCWVGTPPHPLQPQRGFDLSVAPITRPETWQLLNHSTPLLVDLLRDIGGTDVVERVDPLLVARSNTGANVLSHIRNVASGFGYTIERQPVSDRFSSGFQFRDALRVLRRPLSAVLPEYLTALGVEVVTSNNIKLRHQKDGITHILGGDQKFTANHIVLASDDAIRRHANQRDIDANFINIPTAGFLVEPVSALASSVVHDLEAGLTIYQRKNAALDCVAPASFEVVEPRICEHIDADRHPRLAGHAKFQALHTKDGAPLFASLGTGKINAIAGLGASGLFQAPAIARVLSGNGNPSEVDYFSRRSTIGGENKRMSIAEFSPVIGSGESHD